ncbi:putative acetyltransferase [Glaciihabitans tibetensis]|uniref:Putative acetyltransferase n=1 Tax=Glaciihabitans tibetensis TaxID=1266600 RepID=A0A2T0VDQ5_9MICO|nr:GNAT family N-acetyltransferase [Glaciihabitans tibetensis]PRY68303.1 putative acetyltransferase [Glaciihabitans tibetensis]
MTNFYPPALRLSIASESDRGVLEQLWTMFRHEMSAYSGALPDARGRFRQERLDNALGDSSTIGYIVWLNEAPVGLCIVRDGSPPERIITSFFLVNAARRLGHGRAVIRAVTGQQPGRWAVAFQEANSGAGAFWRSVAAEMDPDWSSTRERVPGRDDLPADVWINFRALTAGGTPRGERRAASTGLGSTGLSRPDLGRTDRGRTDLGAPDLGGPDPSKPLGTA